jgi:hypothetical protein
VPHQRARGGKGPRRGSLPGRPRILNIGTTLPLGRDGKFRVFSNQAADLIIDVIGCFGVSGAAAIPLNPKQVALKP